MDDIKEAILSDPCLMRFNHNRLVVLRTDFSSLGFGYVVCQPGTDESLEAAMVAYRSGADFAFMTKEARVSFDPWPLAAVAVAEMRPACIPILGRVSLVTGP
jgi:hypothetical protein